ncbi:hypothetical protein [Bradyrhizobium sp. S69]|uniref:hypothetical protein n=1 Tax=Bradyrhizobium sp. S69 TaxID=1641856 RepID=UPI00131AEAC4|nr:hypothetical protein [Bradyrhizobium sp. S69]
MILTCAKHGRSKRDCDNLADHVLKLENDFVTIAEIGNSAALDVRGVIRDMEVLRDGSPSVAALHHVTINPASNCSLQALLDAANRARLEFDPDSVRPYVIVVHGKGRSTLDSDSCHTHAHCVFGHVDSQGRALKDKFSIIRTERLARELEFEMGETPTLGRHHVPVLAQLRKSSPEVAVWLVAAFGETPEKPASAMSSASRNRSKREGINLPVLRLELQKLWQPTKEIGAYRTALGNAGYEIAAGEKAGVWIVRNIESKRTVFALDRLLRLKRGEVQKMMEVTNEAGKFTEDRKQSSPNFVARKAAVRPGQDNRHENRTSTAAPRIAGRDRDQPGNGPHRENRRDLGEHLDRTANPQRRHRGLQSKARFSDRLFYRKAALVRLRTASIIRLAAILALRSANPIHEHVAQELLDPIFINAVDIWGIPIPPPRPRC